mmetsp:Transcript_3531/g.11833  ORF Transcript_3531/g.11833 Transcript_3531/m.11833 type:complete len:364 (-) Transcript_3531:337-1428(-)
MGIGRQHDRLVEAELFQLDLTDVHAVEQHLGLQAEDVERRVERVGERDVQVLVQRRAAHRVEQRRDGDRDVEVDVGALDDVRVLALLGHAGQEGAQRHALGRRRVEWLRRAGDGGDERRLAVGQEVVEDVRRLDEVVLALGHLEEALHLEPRRVPPPDPKARLGVDRHELDAERVGSRLLRLWPRVVRVHVDREDVEVAEDKGGGVVDASLERDERLAGRLERRQVRQLQRAHVHRKALRAPERDRLCKRDAGDARRADRLAHLAPEEAPVVGAAQLDRQRRVQLDGELVLVHDGARNLLEDGHVVNNQPAGHLRLDLTAAAERAGERGESAEPLPAEHEVDLRRRERRLRAEEEQLHVDVHL